MPYKGIDYLRRKLSQKRPRNNIRYSYYDEKARAKDLSISIPKSMRGVQTPLGWCTSSVDNIGDRLDFLGFDELQDGLNIGAIIDANNPDILFSAAILDALICGCSFLYIYPDEDKYPRIQEINGCDATGIIDPTTYMLTEGYAVLERDRSGKPTIEAYFTEESTTIITAADHSVVEIPNPAPYPLLVPVVYQPNATRPFGHSRISRACMAIQDAAVRTVLSSECNREFYSYPQRYIIGTTVDWSDTERWSAMASAMLTLGTDKKGNKPEVGQFASSSQQPHLDQIRLFANLFAGAASLTVDDLGFPSDNPSSAEAIKAAHEQLRVKATKAQRVFAVAFKNAAYLAACVRDNYAYSRQMVTYLKPLWAPLFEPDAAALSQIGDGAIKLNQAVPGYIGADNLAELTGITADGG